MSNQDQFGPIEYVAVEFPGGAPTSAGFEQLLILVDSGVIRILDLEFVTKAADGSVAVVPASTFELADFDLAQFDGAAPDCSTPATSPPLVTSWPPVALPPCSFTRNWPYCR